MHFLFYSFLLLFTQNPYFVTLPSVQYPNKCIILYKETHRISIKPTAVLMETFGMYREEYCFLNYDFTINNRWKLTVASDHVSLIFRLFSTGNEMKLISECNVCLKKNMVITKTVDPHKYHKLLKYQLLFTYSFKICTL